MGEKMAKATVEERGRILIPKEIRDEMQIHGGEEMNIRSRGDEIVITKGKPLEKFQQLKGCIKNSSDDPLKIKNMWVM